MRRCPCICVCNNFASHLVILSFCSRLMCLCCNLFSLRDVLHLFVVILHLSVAFCFFKATLCLFIVTSHLSVIVNGLFVVVSKKKQQLSLKTNSSRPIQSPSYVLERHKPSWEFARKYTPCCIRTRVLKQHKKKILPRRGEAKMNQFILGFRHRAMCMETDLRGGR